ncbi:PREDICTED: junctophilin-1-like [Elephantulus edwardii]|uniref:junctophilin-1-like n=1 Tax=Elephantulus edwardii TaxID=28737 RepID=UPI0003F0880B|nr:PREDICTED: junctophilin-1-like [Elephantulus edwardii]
MGSLKFKQKELDQAEPSQVTVSGKQQNFLFYHSGTLWETLKLSYTVPPKLKHKESGQLEPGRDAISGRKLQASRLSIQVCLDFMSLLKCTEFIYCVYFTDETIFEDFQPDSEHENKKIQFRDEEGMETKTACISPSKQLKLQKEGFFLPGTYQGQWAGGMRHGYGVHQSVPYGMATVIRSPLRTSLASLRSEQSNGSVLHDAAAAAAADSPAGTRGGFVLNFQANSGLSAGKKKGGLFRRGSLLGSMKLRKSESKSSISSKRSSVRSDAAMSRISSSDANSTISFGDVDCDFCLVEDHVDTTTTETYMGEWKNDKRSGFGISERSNGMKYEGEWANNKRHGYGCTVFPDGSKEEGKHKNNVLVRGIRKQLIPIRNTKTREKVDRAIEGHFSLIVNEPDGFLEEWVLPDQAD